MSAEELITLPEFARLFHRNLRACQARAKSGKWQDVEKIGGRWYVFVSVRVLQAARDKAA